MLSSDARRNQKKALVPNDLFEQHYVGEVKGIYHASSGTLNVLSPAMTSTEMLTVSVGMIFPSEEARTSQASEYEFTGCWLEDGLRFQYGNECLTVHVYDLVQNIFSRNSGLLESDVMSDYGVAIFGCGSVGSLVALELARSGVGNFALIDNDVLEYHNICRHQCGVSDVGEYKVDAVRKRILEINPLANVDTYATLAEYLPKDAFDQILGEQRFVSIGCADNRDADVYVNSLCVDYGTPFLSIGFWERAFAGEIFYWLPNKNMPCYKCALGDGSLSQRSSASRRLYTTQEDVADMHFEPGIAVDIDFVTNIGVKILLDIINTDNKKYTARLLPTLQQYTLVCNTNNPAIGGEMAEIFSYPLQVTTSLKVDFQPGCACHAEEGETV